MSRGRPWSARDVERLTKMARGGVTGAEIAQRLGRTRQAVYSRLQIEGVEIRSHFALQASRSRPGVI